jgi:hypothetical protein
MNKSSSNGTQDDKNSPTQWDEDDFIAALGRLETMQNEVRPLQKKGENPPDD